ncbi:hypothetical protein BT69DRAFT_1264327 [Atractiella rhizophila]|nr:hypothetical protein BT69DRAFT_1264327 [Atractiella rhizophila]
MGLSAGYGAVPADDERIALLKKVLESGTSHIDTAAVYGDSEALLGKLFGEPGWREKAFIATKFGLKYDFSAMSPALTLESSRRPLHKRPASGSSWRRAYFLFHSIKHNKESRQPSLQM